MLGKWNWSGYRTTGIFQSITPYHFMHCDRVRQHKKQMSHFWLWLSTIEHNKGVLLRYSDHSLIRCILMLPGITILDGDHKLYFLFRLNNREIQNSPEWLTKMDQESVNGPDLNEAEIFLSCKLFLFLNKVHSSFVHCLDRFPNCHWRISSNIIKTTPPVAKGIFRNRKSKFWTHQKSDEMTNKVSSLFKYSANIFAYFFSVGISSEPTRTFHR